MTSLIDVLPIDRTALLTTTGPTGPRTRPVAVQPDPLGRAGVVAVLTPASSRKVAEIREQPAVNLAGTTADGFFSIEAHAEVLEAPALVAETMARFVGGAAASEAGGDPASATGDEAAPADGPALVLLRLCPRSAQQWVVHSPRPFDNEVEDLAL